MGQAPIGDLGLLDFYPGRRFPRAYSGLTVHRCPGAKTITIPTVTSFTPVAEEKQRDIRGWARGSKGGAGGCLTRFIRTLRRSREFRTKGGFLDSVELSLSLRFSCKKHVMDVTWKVQVRWKACWGREGGFPHAAQSFSLVHALQVPAPWALQEWVSFHLPFLSRGPFIKHVLGTVHAAACYTCGILLNPSNNDVGQEHPPHWPQERSLGLAQGR